MGEEVKEQLELTKEEIDIIVAENNKFKEQFPKLKNYVDQLQQQNKFLIEQLEKNEYADLHKRIEYLFKVLEHKNTFANTDRSFVDEVISELISILKIEKQPEVEEVK